MGVKCRGEKCRVGNVRVGNVKAGMCQGGKVSGREMSGWGNQQVGKCPGEMMDMGNVWKMSRRI